MHNVIHIYATGHVEQAEGVDNKPLKTELKERAGKTIRRIDQLTRLALVGALRCTESIQLPTRTGLVMTSKYGSLNNSLSVLQEIFQQNSAPSPLKFVNTVSNAASFYVAEQLKLSANNIFIARESFALEGCFKTACQDLNSDRLDAVLVGLVEEIGHPIDEHRRRLNLDKDTPLVEASSWFLLSKELLGAAPVASLTTVQEPLELDELQRILSTLSAADRIMLSPNISDSELDTRALEKLHFCNAIKRHGEFSSALAIAKVLWQSPKNDSRMIYIDCNSRAEPQQQFSLIEFR